MMRLTTTLRSGDYPHWVKDEIGSGSKYFNLSFVTIEPNLLCVLCVSKGRLFQNNSESTNIQEIEVAFPPFLCSGDVLKSRMMASDLVTSNCILYVNMRLAMHFNL